MCRVHLRNLLDATVQSCDVQGTSDASECAHPSLSKFLICAANFVGKLDASKRSMSPTPLVPDSSLRQLQFW